MASLAHLVFGRSRAVLPVLPTASLCDALLETTTAGCGDPLDNCFSFAVNIFWTADYSRSVYFPLPSRAWELAAGALCTYARPSRPDSGVAHYAGPLGVALIASAMVFLADTTPFPGWAAAVPFAGSAILTFATTDTSQLTAKLLRWRRLIEIGRMSYSLYLWHWPVLVLGRFA